MLNFVLSREKNKALLKVKRDVGEGCQNRRQKEEKEEEKEEEE
jgi:hypothetical protein